MIAYDNTSIKSFFMYKGSVIPRALPLALVTGLMGAGWAVMRNQDLWPEDFGFSRNDEYRLKLSSKPFAMNFLSIVLGFVITQRSNMALNRWMNAIESVQSMLSYWRDAFNQVNGFMSGQKLDSDQKLKERFYFQCRMAHYFALISCLACVRLRNKGEDVTSIDAIPIKPKYPVGQNKRGLSGRFTGGVTTGVESETGVVDLNLTLFHAPSQEEVDELMKSKDKVQTVGDWILNEIMIQVRAGVLDSPPPIVTRIHAEFLLGMNAFKQAVKVAVVPFPFPFSQMAALLLVMLYFTLPLYVDTFTSNILITPLVSFLVPLVYCGLNNVSIELETPYGTDYNAVDIEERHNAFVKSMEDALATPMDLPDTSAPMLLNHFATNYKDKVVERYGDLSVLSPTFECGGWINGLDYALPEDALGLSAEDPAQPDNKDQAAS
jgi:predicted membrane chloride channel (bestrophin family)